MAGRSVNGVSQKTCKTSQLPILFSRKNTGCCIISFFIFMRACRILKFCIAGIMLVSMPLCRLMAQSDDTVRVLDTLTVEGNRKSVSLESSVPLQRFDSKDLQLLGVGNAGDALKYMSGVTVRDYGGVGGLKTVAIRGMGAQHTAVIYDGVAVGDCQSGQVDLGRFSTDNLNMLQLSVGQSDDIYQTARIIASAGAVSLETSMPQENTLKTTLRAGSYGLYQANVLFSRLLGTKWKLTAFVDYTKSDGDYKFNIKDISAKRNNSDVESLRGELNISFKKEKVHSLRAKIYAYCSSRGLPGSVIVDNPISNERLFSRNAFAQLFYEYVPTSAFRIKTYLKHNYTYDRNKIYRAANDILHNEYVQNESDVSLTMKWTPSFMPGVAFALSEELFYNRLSTTNSHVTMANRPKRMTSLTAFSARYVNDVFSATASLLYTSAREHASEGEIAPDRHRLSPAVSLSLYPFGNNISFRLSYKDIFRLPTFNDLYYLQVGNYRLKPEKNRMINLGATYVMQGIDCLKELSLSVDAYCGAIKDKIVAVPGLFVWKMNNVDEVSLTGVDVNITSMLELLPEYTIKATAAYSYMRAVDDTDDSSVKGDQIIYTPRHSGSATLVLSTPILNAGYSLLWSGLRYRLSQNIPLNEVDSYCDHSLWLSKDWNIGKFVLTSRFEIQNIADDNYEIVRYYPMQGRSFNLSILLTL